MYNIVFGCNDGYIKYLSVLIGSIIKNTNNSTLKNLYNESIFKNKIDFESIGDEECYIFHVLIDYISDDNYNKLNNMINFYNRKYFKCKLEIHTLDSAKFKNLNLPIWVEHYATYFRLCLSEFLPRECNTCLYLDVDMLVVSDIRELFILDLQETYGAVTPDAMQWDGTKIHAKSRLSNKNIVFEKGPNYFNAGFMLVNLKKWRENDIDKKLLNYANIYNFSAGDQDILNCLLKENTIKLPCKWNFWAGHLILDRKGIVNHYKDESSKPYWNYTRAEMEENLKNIKIIHFTHYVVKPWESCFKEFDIYNKPVYYSFYDLWWQVARELPIFGCYFTKLENEIWRLNLRYYSNFVGDIHIKNQMAENNTFNINSNFVVKNHLSYRVGRLIIETKNFSSFVKFPFKLVQNFIGYIIIETILNFYYGDNEIAKLENSIEGQKIKNYISYQIGYIIINSFRYWYKGSIFLIPYRLYKLFKMRHNNE
ncbi:hypothetical protein A0M37_01585 [Campylobacter jejuni]|nr:hypothetical protein A0M37_01585 [Campylobacter jejuni]OEX03306.1 hypothetical protein A0M41_03635 [Campylobacter jejuni]